MAGVTVAFDTLKAATRLREEAGFDETKARVLVSTFAEGMVENLATKDDIAGLRREIATLATREDVAALRAEMHEMGAGLRDEMHQMDANRASEIKQIDTNLRAETRQGDIPKSSPNAAGGRRQLPRAMKQAGGLVSERCEAVPSQILLDGWRNDAQKRAAGRAQAAMAARRPVLGAWRCLRWYWERWNG